MLNNVKISFIVPIYNNQSLLARCVNSLLQQTLKDIEIILIDDGSTDSSALLCQEYAKLDFRVKFFGLEHVGVSQVRNYGISKASGEYIGFVDNDDFLDVDFAKQMYAVVNNGLVSMVCCGVKKIFSDIGKSIDYYPQLLRDDKFLSQNPNIRNPVWNKIFKTSIIKKHHVAFPERAYFAEDYAFVFMFYVVAKAYGNIQYVNRTLYNYWRHPYSTMSNVHVDLDVHLHNCMENMDCMVEFFEINKIIKDNLFHQVIINYFLITLPLLVLHNSLLNNNHSVSSIKQYISAYFYYQHKYQNITNFNSRLIRYKFIIIVTLTIAYSPIWRKIKKMF